MNEPSIDDHALRYSTRNNGRTRIAAKAKTAAASSHQLHRERLLRNIEEQRIPVHRERGALPGQAPGLFASISTQAHRTLSMGINAISLTLHQDIRADEWMLYHHHSTSATGGMTHAECRVYTEDGALLASFTVDGMVRPFDESGRARDERMAL